ncbi:unnamed protein product [Knipowitschia caucasica]
MNSESLMEARNGASDPDTSDLDPETPDLDPETPNLDRETTDPNLESDLPEGDMQPKLSEVTNPDLGESAEICVDPTMDCGEEPESCGEEPESWVDVCELRVLVVRLKQKLLQCKTELKKVKKQLSHCEGRQQSTERYNANLRAEVEQLSAELHQRKIKGKKRSEAETQTEEYVWSDTDYYNYYYSAYSQEPPAGGSTEGEVVETCAQEPAAGGSAVAEAGETSVTSTQEGAGTKLEGENPETDYTAPTPGDAETAAAQGECGSIADMLRSTAEQAMCQTGFVFDETTGMYYDHSTGFYYDSVNQLYYDNNTGIYYYYCSESGKYEFYSKIEVQSEKPTSERSYSEWKTWKLRQLKTELKGAQGLKVEDVTRSLAKMKISNYCNQAPHRVWPPCVRVTVVRSPVLQVGTLFILTADCTATIGREKNMDHAIRISELGVSKFHAEVHYDPELQGYVLVDQGSQNGTVINGNRILQPKQKSPPHLLTHGDEVKMGDTVLSFHIHQGTDTCDGCEPGQILAHLSKHPRGGGGGGVGSAGGGAVVSREDKEAQRVKQLKSIKAKYGIQSTEEVSVMRSSQYKDRAESRRQAVGSDGFVREDEPASVHTEISEGNKGRQMLEKMGWKRGEGLGKEGSGIKDPIQLQIRKAQSGLGAAPAVSVDDPSLNKTKNQKNWDKARERFNAAVP